MNFPKFRDLVSKASSSARSITESVKDFDLNAARRATVNTAKVMPMIIGQHVRAAGVHYQDLKLGNAMKPKVVIKAVPTGCEFYPVESGLDCSTTPVVAHNSNPCSFCNTRVIDAE